RRILFDVAAYSADQGDGHDCREGKIEDREPVVTEEARNKGSPPAGETLRLHDIVDNDLNGPRLQNVSGSLADYGKQGDAHRFPIRTQDPGEPEPLGARELGQRR